jgi:hypothetical protein
MLRALVVSTMTPRAISVLVLVLVAALVSAASAAVVAPVGHPAGPLSSRTATPSTESQSRKKASREQGIDG